MTCRRSFSHKDLRAKRGAEGAQFWCGWKVGETLKVQRVQGSRRVLGDPALPVPTLVWSTLWGALSAVASTLPDSAPPRSPPSRTLTGILTLTPYLLSNWQECKQPPALPPLHSSAVTPTWQGKLYPGLAIKATFQKKKLQGPERRS